MLSTLERYIFRYGLDKMKYFLLLITCFLCSCATTSDEKIKVKFVTLKPQVSSTLNLEIELFLYPEEIPGEIIPSDLSEAIGGSLQWKWYGTEKLPNVCYLIYYPATDTEPADFDYGFAMLDVTRHSVSGNLLRWPDAGLKVELSLLPDNYAKGRAEWWGGPHLVFLDEDGNEILEESEPEIAILEGKVKIDSSLDYCFELIRDKIKQE